MYRVFNTDGTGEEIFEEKSKRFRVPFTYTITDTPADTGVGFSQLEITCEWTYCGGKIVGLDDSCIPKEERQERVTAFPIYIGHDEQNRITLNPYGVSVGTQTYYWRRVELKFLPGDVQPRQLTATIKKLRLIGQWEVYEHPRFQNSSALRVY